MARIQSGPINTQAHERQQMSGGPLPNGIYKGIVVRTGQKTTNGDKGPGVMVEVEFDITWPEEFSNRKFWDGFNVVNPTQKTADIGIEALSDLAEACYHKGFILEDDEQLMGKEVIMELYIKKGEDYKDKQGIMRKGVDKNRCGKYWNRNTNVEEAKKAMKESKRNQPAAGGVQAAAPVAQARPAASSSASKWGSPKPASAPSAVATPANPQSAAPIQEAPTVVQAAPPQPAAQPIAQAAPQPVASAAPAGNVAPWKRPKQ